ncbi:MAG: hypothetical protein HOC91_12825 [Nitrospinaceae bacterium]|jgi:Trp operon repressor|nr:hypothetical protein [Nitrospinaceae bacterium]MBT4769089.1 hypothetical protein [Rhodospirillaceae bacterium]MBT5374754.1 hypothetical protein [Rhodospirillaceae bacterium]MBT5659450.1 hypothetical protein [Rhodospirillaceae bacterium]MBT5752172.1 hypothetical protein [Rhodospirillaceae bacterium]
MPLIWRILRFQKWYDSKDILEELTEEEKAALNRKMKIIAGLLQDELGDKVSIELVTC